MVHAQLNCTVFAPSAHSIDTIANLQDAYQSRAVLDRRNPGDVYAAMSCFGICTETVQRGGKSAETAAGEIGDVSQVQRMVVRNCSVAWDKDRDAALYSAFSAVKGMTDPETGIVKTRHTGAGAHFTETVPGLDSETRITAAAQKVVDMYVTNGDDAVLPTGLDQQDTIYIVDQNHVHVPVLVYKDAVCIDFTSSTCIMGIMAFDSSGSIRQCTTRDLYCLPNVSEVYAERGERAYTRRVLSEDALLQEPLADGVDTIRSAQRLVDWLSMSSILLGQANGLRDHQLPDAEPLAADGLTEFETKMKYGRGDGIEQSLSCTTGGGDLSLLGAPLPLQIVSDKVDPQLKGTVRVAPLLFNKGATHSAAVVDDRAGIDMDKLAARVARTTVRNVIGIAMQKIECNVQGDLMLHDGV